MCILTFYEVKCAVSASTELLLGCSDNGVYKVYCIADRKIINSVHITLIKDFFKHSIKLAYAAVLIAHATALIYQTQRKSVNRSSKIMRQRRETWQRK